MESLQSILSLLGERGVGVQRERRRHLDGQHHRQVQHLLQHFAPLRPDVSPENEVILVHLADEN